MLPAFKAREHNAGISWPKVEILNSPLFHFKKAEIKKLNALPSLVLAHLTFTSWSTDVCYICYVDGMVWFAKMPLHIDDI